MVPDRIDSSSPESDEGESANMDDDDPELKRLNVESDGGLRPEVPTPASKL